MTSAEQPRHPQLDFAFIAQGAKIDDDGTFHVVSGGMLGLTVPYLPYRHSLAVVSQVSWRPDDADRSHSVQAQLHESASGKLLDGGAGLWEHDPPSASGHAHHPHTLRPSLCSISLQPMFHRAGAYDLVVFLDEGELAVLPFRVDAL